MDTTINSKYVTTAESGEQTALSPDDQKRIDERLARRSPDGPPPSSDARRVSWVVLVGFVLGLVVVGLGLGLIYQSLLIAIASLVVAFGVAVIFGFPAIVSGAIRDVERYRTETEVIRERG